MNLEDHLGDIVRKAREMSNVSSKAAAAAAGLTETELSTLEETGTVAKLPNFQALANLIGLNPAKLESISKGWLPASKDLGTWREFRCITTDSGGLAVNCYLVWDEVSRDAALFDTGWDAKPALELISENQLMLRHLFVTHTHEDHIAALKEIATKTSARVFGPSRESVSGATSVHEGDRFEIGNLKVEARLTNGHSPGGISYIIEGLSVPVAVVGDSLFAGSMGGAPSAYSLALTNNREKLMTLPAGTVVCPGHGPMTTVGEERQHNPFVGA